MINAACDIAVIPLRRIRSIQTESNQGQDCEETDSRPEYRAFSHFFVLACPQGNTRYKSLEPIRRKSPLMRPAAGICTGRAYTGF